MVVQHILCSRMGKREVKPEPPPEPKTEKKEEDESEKKEKETDEENKEVKEETEESTEPMEVDKEADKTDEEKSEKDKEEKKDEADAEEKKETTEEGDETSPTETAVDAKPQIIEVEEYFVKYRNFSYLHCEWKTEEELYKGDKRIQAKLKRFKQKMQQCTNIFENVSILYAIPTHLLLSIDREISWYWIDCLFADRGRSV